jgi:UDP-N-acetylglucosamine:LPS N-acetylglucosamine transferase
MKRIVYLTFYFKPDLCAGSFRNSPLALELANQAKYKDILIDVYTTLPHRYSTFDVDAPEYEEFNNLRIHRITLPPHKSGMIDQVFSFLKYYKDVSRLNKGKKADLVFASSSRLFTAFLGYTIAKKSKIPLYLDIRDIFVDTMNDVFKSKILKLFVLPALKYIESRTFNYAKHINLISGGFKEYFQKYKNSIITFYSNGIDYEFLQENSSNLSNILINEKKVIVYAGNLGEGQGLHKIIPQAAKLLGNNFEFLIIGDGGTKYLLQTEVERMGINNVILKNPISRMELQKVYSSADFLFLHLNDYPAFRKVLPSKIFELATFNKPILAGVSGYSAKFIKDEINNSFVFNPCDINALVNYLLNNKEISIIDRSEFIGKFKRNEINEKMANSILNYL